jgi:predicted 3-demethylubiquinone-9 3-methyltransferase (glyoxalase superfamily)
MAMNNVVSPTVLLLSILRQGRRTGNRHKKARRGVGARQPRPSFGGNKEHYAMQKIIPFLWFDGRAEEAADFYTSVFKNSKKGAVIRNPEGAPGPVGQVLTAEWEIEGQKYIGLNGGPMFKFSEAVSLQIQCEDQAEVDYYWNRLLEGGEESACGWLKDKFGFSWQVTPTILSELLMQPDKAKAERVFQAMMTMRKIDIATLEAAAGEPAHA